MCLAKHLAVVHARCSALAPCSNVVGIHFLQFPDALAVSIVPDSAIRTVANTFSLCLIGLFLIYLAHGRFVKQAHVQQFCVLTSAEHILENASPVANKVVVHKFLDFFLQHFRIVGILVERLTKLASLVFLSLSK